MLMCADNAYIIPMLVCGCAYCRGMSCAGNVHRCKRKAAKNIIHYSIW
jgi:hypothetical protein